MENKVYVFLAEGFEEIEAITIIDVLRRAEEPVVTVSISDKLEVKGAHKVVIKADKLFAEIDFNKSKLLVLPGGLPGAHNLQDYKPLTDLLREKNAVNAKIAAICAAPKVLGANGILNGKKATCYPGFEKELTGAEFTKEKFVTSYNITTSRGVGTALDFALELVNILQGKSASVNLAEKMLVPAN